MGETTVLDLLAEPFGYEFMRRAILIGGLIGAVCAFVSCYLTLKGWSLLGDALSHAVVPGVALAYIWGLPFSLGAFAAGLLAMGGISFIKANSPLKPDAAMGIVFTGFFALGILLISVYPSQLSLKTVLFGNLLGIADEDALQIVVIGVASLVLLAVRWRDLLLFAFDPVHARTVGLNPRWLGFLLLGLTSLTTVAALQAVGAVLVVAMLITPGATAYLLTQRFGRMVTLAVAMGTLTSMFGAYLSYFLDGSTGGCIVALQTALFGLAFLWAPRRGLLVRRRATREPSLVAEPT